MFIYLIINPPRRGIILCGSRTKCKFSASLQMRFTRTLSRWLSLKGAFNEALKLKFMVSDFSSSSTDKQGEKVKIPQQPEKGIPTKVIFSFASVVGRERSFFCPWIFSSRKDAKATDKDGKHSKTRESFSSRSIVCGRRETEMSDCGLLVHNWYANWVPSWLTEVRSTSSCV